MAQRAFRRFVSFVLTAACFASAATSATATEFVVNTYSGAPAYLSLGRSLARAGDGTFMVVWANWGSQDGDGGAVLGRIFDANGTPVTSEFVVNSYTISDQSYPAVDADGAGNFVVVWESHLQDGSDDGVCGRRFTSTGEPLGGEFHVNTYTPLSQNDASVDAGADGSFVVTWESFGQDGDNDGVFAQLFNAAGERVGSEFAVNTYTTARQDSADVTLLADGKFVVIWESDGQDGDGFGIFGRLFDGTGAPLGGEFQVNTYTTNRQDIASAAADGSGNFLVTWASTHQDTDSNGVFAQMFDSTATPIGSEFQVNTRETGAQDDPAVARRASGEFVIAWESSGQDGSADGVFAQMFDAQGAPVGSEFRANTYTLGSQGDVSVAFDPTGAFVLAWEGPPQDLAGKGVYARVFLPGFDATTTTTLTPPSTTTTTTTSTTTSTVPEDRCGNPVGSTDQILANDALFILRSAVGLSEGALCECDVDASGSIVAVDALQDLRVAVGHAITLHCPPCS